MERSIHRYSLLQVLQECKLDQKTLNRRIIKEALEKMFYSVKFLRELYDNFEIMTCVRQGGLSAILFKCAVEKVIGEWIKKLK